MLLNKSKQIKKCPKRAATTAMKQRKKLYVYIEIESKKTRNKQWTHHTIGWQLLLAIWFFEITPKMHEKKRKKWQRKEIQLLQLPIVLLLFVVVVVFFLAEIAYAVWDWNFTWKLWYATEGKETRKKTHPFLESNDDDDDWRCANRIKYIHKSCRHETSNFERLRQSVPNKELGTFTLEVGAKSITHTHQMKKSVCGAAPATAKISRRIFILMNPFTFTRWAMLALNTKKKSYFAPWTAYTFWLVGILLSGCHLQRTRSSNTHTHMSARTHRFKMAKK